MNFLVIINEFYPDNSPAANRWFSVLKIWVQFGHKIHVVTMHKENTASYETIDGVHIYRTPRSNIETFKIFLKKIRNKDSFVNSNQPSSDLNHIGVLKKIYNVTWRKIYFPDYAFLWKKPALRLAQKIIIKHKIENIITVSWPFTAHTVGFQLKKHFKIKWLADTIDPFCLSSHVNNQFFFKNANKRIEQKIFENADHVSVLTHNIKSKYSELFTAAAYKIAVVPNVYIPIKNSDIQTNFDKSKIIMVFVGTLSLSNRPPDNLLAFFNFFLDNHITVVKVELHFYGDISQCKAVFDQYNYLINKCLFIHGVKSKDEIGIVLTKADILVNVGNINEFQEPSKIIEYVALNKPVLNICNIENDTVLALLNEYNKFFNILPNEIENTQKLILFSNFLLKHKSNLESIPNNFDLDKYLLPNIANQYLNLFITNIPSSSEI